MFSALLRCCLTADDNSEARCISSDCPSLVSAEILLPTHLVCLTNYPYRPHNCRLSQTDHRISDCCLYLRTTRSSDGSRMLISSFAEVQCTYRCLRTRLRETLHLDPRAFFVQYNHPAETPVRILESSVFLFYQCLQ